MKFSIIEIISGYKASIFTIQISGEGDNEFDLFRTTYYEGHEDEFEYIDTKILAWAKNGIAFNDMKDEGPNCVYRFKNQDSLRLYGLKYGTSNLIIGSGGIENPINTPYQDDEIRYDAVKVLRSIDKYFNNLGDFDFTEIKKYINKEFEL